MGLAGATGATFAAEFRTAFTPSDAVEPPLVENRRTPLWATATVAAGSGTDTHPIRVAFTQQSGSPLVNTSGQLGVSYPRVPSVDYVMGLWLVFVVSGTERAAYFLPYGFLSGIQSFHYGTSTEEDIIKVRGSNSRLFFFHSGDIIPATVINIYGAI